MTSTKRNRLYLTFPDYTILTCHKLSKGTGVLNCTRCDAPIAIVAKSVATVLNDYHDAGFKLPDDPKKLGDRYRKHINGDREIRHLLELARLAKGHKCGGGNRR